MSTETGPSQPQPSFDQLISLAQQSAAEISAEELEQAKAEATSVEQAETEEARAEQEHRRKMEKIALFERLERRRLGFDAGWCSYYLLSGDYERFEREREKRPGVFGYAPGGSRRYVQLGAYWSWELKQPPTGLPQDYITAFDEADAFADNIIAKEPRVADDFYSTKLDDFYRAKADVVVVHRWNPETRCGEIFSVRDFPDKEIAWELYSERILSKETALQNWGAYRDSIRSSLQGFSEAALGAEDVEMAIEGYKRLGKMDEPIVISKIQSEVERLRQSRDPADRHKLWRISQKILAVREQAV